MSRAAITHFIVPVDIDDDERISGGNVYDRHVRDGLRGLGWDVRMLALPLGRPASVSVAVSLIPDDAVVLVDGLVATDASTILAAHSRRLRLVVLAHMVAGSMPEARDATGIAREREALGAARRIITTSDWARSQLTAGTGAEPALIVVAHPGTEASAPPARGSSSGTSLLCVGVVAPHKGQDLLVRALAALSDIGGWTCTIAGSLDVAPDFVAELSTLIRESGLETRITLAGVLARPQLAEAYDGADLLVAPSRAESFGMAVADGLARGLPVVALPVGGLSEAIAGNPAGIMPDDRARMQATMSRWLTDGDWRAAVKADAMRARTAARSWETTVAKIASVLTDIAREPSHRPIGVGDIVGAAG